MYNGQDNVQSQALVGQFSSSFGDWLLNATETYDSQDYMRNLNS